MQAAQDGGCAICGCVPSKDEKPLHADHCHADGTIRGLLCNRCNVVLGKVDERVDLLLRAARYLADYAASPRSPTHSDVSMLLPRLESM